MSVNIPRPDYGRVEVSYLTGEGRAEGDTYLEITRQPIQTADGENTFLRDDVSPLRLRLPGFQTLTTSINVPFGTAVGRFDSLLLTQLVFDPNRVLVEQDTGTLQEVGGALPVAGTVAPTGLSIPTSLSLPANLEARIRAFPGRTTLVQVRVSSATFYVDPTYGTYVFNRALFREINNSTTGTDPSAVGTLAARLSDFIRFDLSGLAPDDRPDLQVDVDGTVAANGTGFVYFSGDNIALSSADPGGSFQQIEPVSDEIVVGNWLNKRDNGFQGTYNLSETNPDLSSERARLVAEYGSFYDYTDVLSGGGSFEMIMFPNSGERYDATRQGDLVAIARDANKNITNMYYGGVDLVNGTFELLPIFYLGESPTFAGDAIHPAVSDAFISGTVSNYLNSSGAGTTSSSAAAIRRFSFQFTGTVPTGASSTGTVTVFRG